MCLHYGKISPSTTLCRARCLADSLALEPEILPFAFGATVDDSKIKEERMPRPLSRADELEYLRRDLLAQRELGAVFGCFALGGPDQRDLLRHPQIASMRIDDGVSRPDFTHARFAALETS